jgi:hypothetical protein
MVNASTTLSGMCYDVHRNLIVLMKARQKFLGDEHGVRVFEQ